MVAAGMGRAAMNSAWLLIKSLRWTLLVCAILMWTGAFVFGMMVENNENEIVTSHQAAVFFGFFIMFVVMKGLEQETYTTAYPIRIYQRVWLSMGIQGVLLLLIWLGDATSILLSPSSMESAAPDSTAKIWATLQIIPVVVLFICLIQGPFLARGLLFGVLSCVALLLEFNPVSDIWSGQWYGVFLLHVIGLSIVLFFLAPFTAAAIDQTRYYLFCQNRDQMKYLMPMIRPWRTIVIIDTIINIGIIAVAGILGRAFWVSSPKPFIAISDEPFGVIVHGILFLFAAFLWIRFVFKAYQRTAASGFRGASLLTLWMMQVTFVLEPITRLFGVKSGHVRRCDKCGAMMFVWQRQCSHCILAADVQQERVPLKARIKTFVPYILRIYLVLMALIIMSKNYNIEVKCATQGISLQNTSNPLLCDQVTADLRATIESETIPWLRSIESEAIQSKRFPRRYDIHIDLSDQGTVYISCLCPYWESSEELTQTIAQDIVRRLQNRYSLRVGEMRADHRTFFGLWNAPSLHHSIRWTEKRSRNDQTEK